MYNNITDIENFFIERKKLGIQLGLDRMNKLLNQLDHPEKKLTAIHVAGTNGKGSTTTFISHGLLANGYQVGVFTSPSFTGLTGHILLNHKQMTDDEFVKLFHQVYPAISHLDQLGIYATEFEIITAMALLYFSQHADIAIIEAGMGGREDTTNCLFPILSIITNVDKDHMNFLGQTLAEIASHKAGIIKKGTPVVLGSIHQEAFSVIADEAKEKKAPLYRLHQHFTYEDIRQKANAQQFVWRYEEKRMNTRISMLGEHQILNCSVALMALHVIQERGIRLQSSKILAGLAKALLPGRFEIISRGTQTIVLDSAHNVAGIKAFIHTVETTFRSIKNKHLVFAAFKDKDIDKMLSILLPYFSTITLTTFQHPRAIASESLQHIIKKTGKPIKMKEVATIINRLNQESTSDENIYFFTGSLHFIAEIRKYFTN